MPFFLLGDEWNSDPAWGVLADKHLAGRKRVTPAARTRVIRDLKACLVDLHSETAHHKKHGYLTEHQVNEWCPKRIRELLETSVLGTPPKLHRPGDECPCLGDGEWVEGFSHRIHQFSKKNPSPREKERKDTQERDLNNVGLKHLVWVRDGGCCRYCRSGILKKKSGRNKDLRKVLTFDHVDPDAPAGSNGENFVTCCKRCNTYKGRRTPDEADMVLLPVPTAEEIAAWEARGQAVFDMVLDHSPIKPGSTADQPEHGDPPIDPELDPQSDPHDATDQQTGEDPCPETGDHQQEQPAGSSAQCLGRVGQPQPDRLASRSPFDTQPARTSDAPDIYHGRTRPPAPPQPPPPEGG